MGEALTPATLRVARSGPSGMVQLAFNRETQEQVAIKFLLRGNTFNAPSIVRELQNHRLCHLHPHIVALRVRASPANPPAILCSALPTGVS